ncbi:tRNA (adenosine(37)-N6)-dimethylallyltransferase MiaA [Paenibacillus macerans]|uniref:tRNA dimethylallyltransferase n=2 Tax=Paenibacillus macerans TaxID=44252 RepID=A0A090ZEB4_PAEMA|nr:tRNA (adenosine(37)-N6)-dimethylallyltransferase MiaA [Paenibacillus macerans]KFN08778.1 tRNA dimethylallyltransferase [Paenibacillus macerans]MBS5913683.1 tRNA (adenosine(37)-N6)-dimethylallyltransferase MiaA [Paenibacillus macerans]MCY7562190.1 tRNA (adenosine(37)-N6)-dimethylallyltransferase MiaA [Paenibacillus macerans]MEC0139299.1 tRNA (adenosine(37)-N6)-dimethylallyltransferase MiaA [Paenibacillus macerans]MEC0153815.1 tRNA (adenosine(37)-N6)-dimethylallyltransferase MiaA [Paenibacill
MTINKKPRLLVLVGPTAVGKTKLSVEIAKAFSCEVISGDSMQVYRGMDIGTAKIAPAEMEGVPHHLIDVLEPDEPFSVAQFQEWCRKLIPEIESRGHLPFIVGGTGLYIESVCYEFQFTEAGADEAFRAAELAYAEEHGAEALHAKLAAIDPRSAARLHPNDVRRVIRAMEIHHLTGTTLSEQLDKQIKESPYDLCVIGLTMDRQMLYNRIERRIDEMLRLGLVDEVRRLLRQGYSRELVSMQGLGYKEIAEHLEDGVPLPEAVEKLKRDTRRFAKRQLSWFRHMKEIAWIDAGSGENFSGILAAAHAIIAGKFPADLEYNSKH